MGAREKLLGAKVPVERVYVRALDETYTLRGMTGAERDAFEASCFEGRGKKREFSMRNLRAKLVAFCCVDDSGKRIFSDDDVPTLGEVRADVVDRLFGVAQRLSGLREEDAEELGLSSATPTTSDTSSSASPSN
jgi:hypothetical protein